MGALSSSSSTTKKKRGTLLHQSCREDPKIARLLFPPSLFLSPHPLPRLSRRKKKTVGTKTFLFLPSYTSPFRGGERSSPCVFRVRCWLLLLPKYPCASYLSSMFPFFPGQQESCTQKKLSIHIPCCCGSKKNASTKVWRENGFVRMDRKH